MRTRTIAILVALVAITSIAAAQNTATNGEPRVVQLIQLNYLDVATVIRLFGGNIIPNVGYQGQPHGPRGGYSHAHSGSQVGGGYNIPRAYGSQQQTNYGNYGYGGQSGSYGYGSPNVNTSNDQLPAPVRNTDQQYNAN